LILRDVKTNLAFIIIAIQGIPKLLVSSGPFSKAAFISEPDLMSNNFWRNQMPGKIIDCLIILFFQPNRHARLLGKMDYFGLTDIESSRKNLKILLLFFPIFLVLQVFFFIAIDFSVFQAL
jgi:hypothetical protein